jgi:hypothetical protein
MVLISLFMREATFSNRTLAMAAKIRILEWPVAHTGLGRGNVDTEGRHLCTYLTCAMERRTTMCINMPEQRSKPIRLRRCAVVIPKVQVFSFLHEKRTKCSGVNERP